MARTKLLPGGHQQRKHRRGELVRGERHAHARPQGGFFDPKSSLYRRWG